MSNEENNLLRVTIDTNLVISGTISPNNAPSQLLTAWAQGGFNWIMTQDTFNELEEVLNRNAFRTKYHIDEQEVQTFLNDVTAGAEFISPTPPDPLPIHRRDIEDDILLACAIGGNCDYFITGDEDLLVLNGKPELGNLQAVEAATFLQELG